MALSVKQINGRKGRIDLFRAIIDAVMLPISEGDDKTVFDTLAMAREELKNRPQEYQQLLIDLRNFLDEGGHKDPPRTVLKGAESLMNHINQVLPVRVSDNDAAVQPAIGSELDQPGTMSAAKEAMHILEESRKTKEDFMEAIVKLLTIRLSEVDQEKFGPGAILMKAFDNIAEMGGWNEMRSFLVDLTNLHPDPSYDTETYEQLAAQALKRLDDFDGLAYYTDDGCSDTDDGSSHTDDGSSHTDDPTVEPGTTSAARRGAADFGGEQTDERGFHAGNQENTENAPE